MCDQAVKTILGIFMDRLEVAGVKHEFYPVSSQADNFRAICSGTDQVWSGVKVLKSQYHSAFFNIIDKVQHLLAISVVPRLRRVFPAACNLPEYWTISVPKDWQISMPFRIFVIFRFALQPGRFGQVGNQIHDRHTQLRFMHFALIALQSSLVKKIAESFHSLQLLLQPKFPAMLRENPHCCPPNRST